MSSDFGRYRLVRRLAVGGMAEIFLAELGGAAGFRRQVVIKRMLPEYAVDNDLVQSFLYEARLSSFLTHPRIGQVLELGNQDGSYFLVMEYIEGHDLASCLALHRRENKKIPADVALRIACDMPPPLCCLWLVVAPAFPSFPLGWRACA